MNLSVYFNHEDAIEVLYNLKCTDGEINKVVKASLLRNKQSRYYRDFFPEPQEQKVDKESIIEDFIRNTQPAEFVIRQQELLNKVKFTPNL